MREGYADQRVRMTQALLKTALVQLLQQNHISKVSVRALCDAAGINRSTFYLHYQSPYDLLERMKKEVAEDLVRYLGEQDVQLSKPMSQRSLQDILSYFRQKAALFRCLLGENTDFAFQRELTGIAQIMSLKSLQTFDAATKLYVETFAVAGCVNVIERWLQGGAAEEPAHMARLLIDMLFFGLGSLEGPGQ